MSSKRRRANDGASADGEDAIVAEQGERAWSTKKADVNKVTSVAYMAAYIEGYEQKLIAHKHVTQDGGQVFDPPRQLQYLLPQSIVTSILGTCGQGPSVELTNEQFIKATKQMYGLRHTSNIAAAGFLTKLSTLLNYGNYQGTVVEKAIGAWQAVLDYIRDNNLGPKVYSQHHGVPTLNFHDHIGKEIYKILLSSRGIQPREFRSLVLQAVAEAESNAPDTATFDIDNPHHIQRIVLQQAWEYKDHEPSPTGKGNGGNNDSKRQGQAKKAAGKKNGQQGQRSHQSADSCKVAHPGSTTCDCPWRIKARAREAKANGAAQRPGDPSSAPPPPAQQAPPTAPRFRRTGPCSACRGSRDCQCAWRLTPPRSNPVVHLAAPAPPSYYQQPHVMQSSVPMPTQMPSPVQAPPPVSYFMGQAPAQAPPTSWQHLQAPPHPSPGYGSGYRPHVNYLSLDQVRPPTLPPVQELELYQREIVVDFQGVRFATRCCLDWGANTCVVSKGLLQQWEYTAGRLLHDPIAPVDMTIPDQHSTLAAITLPLRFEVPTQRGVLFSPQMTAYVCDGDLPYVLLGQPVLKQFGVDLNQALDNAIPRQLPAPAMPVSSSSVSPIINMVNVTPLPPPDPLRMCTDEEILADIERARKDIGDLTEIYADPTMAPLLHAPDMTDGPAAELRLRHEHLQRAVNNVDPDSLTYPQHEQLAALIDEYRDVFRAQLGQDPLAKVEPMLVQLKPGAHPVQARARIYHGDRAAALHRMVSLYVSLDLALQTGQDAAASQCRQYNDQPG